VTSPASMLTSDFKLIQNGLEQGIESVTLSEEDARVLVLSLSKALFYDSSIQISYTGTGIMHEDQMLATFELETVQNLMARHFEVPGKSEAEHFYMNNGLILEDCSDVGGGQNTGYAHVGDYLDYVMNVPKAGEYEIDFRIATERSGAKLSLQVDQGEGFTTIGTMTFSNTGGWQKWATQSTTVQLEAGKYLFRLLVTGSEHNLNWFQFEEVPVSVGSDGLEELFSIYPNPASGHAIVRYQSENSRPAGLEILDGMGRLIYKTALTGEQLKIDTSGWSEGLYFVRLSSEGRRTVRKLIVKN
jgi:endoglucanase